MFYVKTKLSEESNIITEITDENVFCTCPGCGAEVCIGDITELAAQGDFDLYGTAIYCKECGKKATKKLEKGE